MKKRKREAIGDRGAIPKTKFEKVQRLDGGGNGQEKFPHHEWEQKQTW